MTKIMIVDNDKNTAETIKTALEAEGYQTVTAYGGQECLNMLKKVKIDLILLDIMMPEVDGIQVATKLSEDSELKKVPIIVISALPIESSQFANKRLGGGNFPNVKDMMEKPFEIDELIEKVKGVLSKT